VVVIGSALPPIFELDTPIFERVWVDYAVRGTARISWSMRRDFTDPGPHEFQLQVNKHNGETDQWEDVGTPVTNLYYALDDEARLYGKTMRVVYRVLATTPLGHYTSEIGQILGMLSVRQWLMFRAIVRRTLLMPRGLVHHEGYLLKRKHHGTICSCVDPFTGGILNSDHEECGGTGKVTGFWTGTEHTMFDLAPAASDNRLDPQQQRGTISDDVRAGSFIGIPQMERGDVWVDANSDARFYILGTKNEAEINMVPIIVQAELRLAPFSDVVYSIDVDTGS
jgi:hypothetical protein